MSYTPVMRSSLLLCALAGVLTACGSGEPAPLTVYGASSLKQVLPEIGDATYAFAGSDTLAQQIREGAPADVLASASARYPRDLANAGLCDEPVAFATNSLVLIVPTSEPKIAAFDDLEAGGFRLAVASESVPIGGYTREALARLGEEAVLTANTVSSEQDAAGIVSKVALGSADAGIAYATDASAAGDRVTAVPLPTEAQPTITYAACVVRRNGSNLDAARDYVAALVAPAGQAALREAGFGPAP